ncbi:MAG: hypothetical protein AMJ93_09775 [Anaerolineae bacterium SM23_84]|nr:MAG: hypothetical protein AMJ93_09775 [Anaerolineae bacterium SM23_84]
MAVIVRPVWSGRTWVRIDRQPLPAISSFCLGRRSKAIGPPAWPGVTVTVMATSTWLWETIATSVAAVAQSGCTATTGARSPPEPSNPAPRPSG